MKPNEKMNFFLTLNQPVTKKNSIFFQKNLVSSEKGCIFEKKKKKGIKAIYRKWKTITLVNVRNLLKMGLTR